MPFSYFLSWDSPHVDSFLQATMTVAYKSGTKSIVTDITLDGILIIYDKELSQDAIMELSLQLIATEDIYTPHDNISNDTSGQAGDI